MKTNLVKRHFRATSVALACVAATASAWATDGYFPHGYGIEAKGMGGASIAMTSDIFTGANNPAAAAFAGNKLEVGVDVFSPSRGVDRTGSTTVSVSSDSNTFYIPEFAYNRAIGDKMGVGITVYGNGGMNTDYTSTKGCPMGPMNLFCGSSRLGIDMMQLIVAPTFAYKFDANNSVGVSPLFVEQVFKADGLQAFTGSSTNGAAMTNNGYDTSTGFGMRLGYLGKINDIVSVGASYSPKIIMSKFSKYAGLFADSGEFDIPENYVMGVAINATPDVTVALDYERINYSAVGAVGNSSSIMLPFGSAGGPGFGWQNINVWKLGVQWKQTKDLTLRAGVNVGQNPVTSADASLNLLAPGVVTTHYTLGGTYSISDSSEVTVSYMSAPSNSVSGSNANFGTVDSIHMSQQSLGVQFGWKFR